MINFELWKSAPNADAATHTTTDDGKEIVSMPVGPGSVRHLELAHSILRSEGFPDETTDSSLYKILERQLIMDFQVIEMVGSQGSDLSVQTDVEHWAYFKKEIQAARFAKAAIERGYAMRNFRSINKKKFCVKFAHSGSLELSDICVRTLWLKQLAIKTGGNYDGWEVTADKRGNLVPIKEKA